MVQVFGTIMYSNHSPKSTLFCARHTGTDTATDDDDDDDFIGMAANRLD